MHHHRLSLVTTVAMLLSLAACAPAEPGDTADSVAPSREAEDSDQPSLSRQASAVPPCYQGTSIWNGTSSSGSRVGCYYSGGVSSTAVGMCGGAEMFVPGHNGSCFVCVTSAYTAQIEAQSWSGLYVGTYRSSATAANFSCLGTAYPPPGLKGWWRLDEASGVATTTDSSTQFNHGTYVGTQSVSAGVQSNAHTFNSSVYSQVPDATSLDVGTSSFTVAAWVKFPTTNGLTRTILDKRGPTTNHGYSVFVYNGRPGIQIANAGSYTNYLATGAVAADNAYHLVTVTVNRGASPTIVFTRDGGSSETVTPTLASTVDLSNSQNLRLGRTVYGGGANAMGVPLDEVMLFDRALTATQIAAIYATPP